MAALALTLVREGKQGRGTDEDRERDPTLLSSREGPDKLETGHARYPKRAEVPAVLLVRLAREELAEVCDAVHSQVEGIDVVLGEVCSPPRKELTFGEVGKGEDGGGRTGDAETTVATLLACGRLQLANQELHAGGSRCELGCRFRRRAVEVYRVLFPAPLAPTTPNRRSSQTREGNCEDENKDAPMRESRLMSMLTLARIGLSLEYANDASDS